jgi:hypothetical protein
MLVNLIERRGRVKFGIASRMCRHAVVFEDARRGVTSIRSEDRQARLQLRAGRVLSTLAVVKEVAEPEVLPATGVASDPRGADSKTDPLHHRQRRMRALQFLRDAEHAAALAFGLVARTYPVVDHYRKLTR